MRKEIWKFLPCATYDVEKLETFFNDMSQNGYNLRKEGIFLNIAYFEESKQRYYYHLVPRIIKNKEEVAFKEQQEQNGYVFIDIIGDFYIYAHTKPFEIEIDQKIYRRLNKIVPENLFGILLTVVLFIAIEIKAAFLLFVIACGSLLTLAMLGIFMYLLIKNLYKHFIYKDIYQKFISNEKREEKQWRKTRNIYPIRIFFNIGILILVIIGVFLRLDMDKQELPQDVQSIPFATLVDFELAEMPYSRDGLFGEYTSYSDWLAPINYEWEESGDFDVDHPNDQLDTFAILDANYHQTIHPLIASRLVEEHAYRNLHDKYYDYVEIEVDANDYNVDELRILTNRHHTIYILRLDTKVLCYDLFWDSSKHQMEYVIPILVESIKST